MKKAFAILLLAVAALAAQAPAQTSGKASKATKKTAAPQALTIPKNAVANADGTWAWKDPQGKSWMFVNTPFGVIKTAAASAVPESNSMDGVKATDAGDKVRFERATPFGPIKWEKNKTDLTDDERGLLKSQSTGQSAKQD